MKKVAVIMPQPRCNMVCEFCVTEDSMGAMTLEQGYELLENLKKEDFAVAVLGGGEPFLWKPGILNLAKKAKELGFLVQIGTNGIMLPLGFERIDYVDRWVLPLESPNPTTHNRMRRYQGKHCEIILEKLFVLQKVKKQVTISTVLTQWNKQDLHVLANFLTDYHTVAGNIHAWHLYQFIPEGRSGSLSGEQLLLSVEEYEKLVNEMFDLKLPFKVFKRMNMYKSKQVEFFYYENGKLCRKYSQINIGI